MVSAATYEVIGVRKDGSERRVKRVGCPGVDWLCNKFMRDDTARPCAVVVRYYPSRKGWRIIDLRKASQVRPTGPTTKRVPSNGWWAGARYGKRVPSNGWWAGARYGKRYYATEAGAIMMALHLLNQPDVAG